MPLQLCLYPDCTPDRVSIYPWNTKEYKTPRVFLPENKLPRIVSRLMYVSSAGKKLRANPPARFQRWPAKVEIAITTR